MTTNVLERFEPSLRSFFIFNSDYCKLEGEEHKKILYYYPDDIELNTKIKDVGLSEAIIAFTGAFVKNDSSKALHTQKTTQLFYQPEPGYWMVVAINVPKEIRIKDGVEITDYCGGKVHDNLYQALLKQFYNMFRLQMGSFVMNLTATIGVDIGVAVENKTKDDIARERLQQQLKTFFDVQLSTLKFPICDVLSMTRSIQYLPIDQQLFLRAHNFTQMILATFPTINDIVFLYKESVVISGRLDPVEFYCLHEYILDTILRKSTQSTRSGATQVKRSNSFTTTSNNQNGCFLTLSENDDEATTSAPPPLPPNVYLSRENVLKSYSLILYRVLDVTLCFIVDVVNAAELEEFLKDLQTYINPQLTSIATDIGDTLKKRQQQEQQSKIEESFQLLSAVCDKPNTVNSKYLLVNELSLKHLSNITFDRIRCRNKIHQTSSLPINVLNLIADLNQNDVNDENCNDSIVPIKPSSYENVQVKTTDDFWIVKRRCNWKKFYAIIFNSKATLLDITQKANLIFENELMSNNYLSQ